MFDARDGAYKRHWGAYGAAPRDATSRQQTASRSSRQAASTCTSSASGRFGRTGRMAGEFKRLRNIAIDRQGNLYTSEVGFGRRVQKFALLSF